jgi:hypothetical protein
LKVLASKASVRGTVPWVRIPPSPPLPLFSFGYKAWCLSSCLLCTGFRPTIAGKVACRHVETWQWLGQRKPRQHPEKNQNRKTWNLCPAAVEPNGRLRDKIRAHGKIELHPGGCYYFEWWQDGKNVSKSKIAPKSQTARVAKRPSCKRTARESRLFKKFGAAKGPRLPKRLPRTSNIWSRPSASPKPTWRANIVWD